MSGCNPDNLYSPDALWHLGKEANLLGACSGAGECVSLTNEDGGFNGFGCECNAGYTGLSDWINLDGYDCQIFVLGYQLCWALLGTIQCITYVAAIPYLKARYESYKEIKAAKDKKGEKYGLLDNRGALTCLMYYGGLAPMFFLIVLVKIFAPNERIGVTPFVTILYAAIRIWFYLGVSLFQPSLLEAVAHGSGPRMKQILAGNRRVSWAIFVMHVIVALLPFITLSAVPTAGAKVTPETDFTLAQILNLLNLGALALTGMWISAQGQYLLVKIGKTLTKSYEMSQQEKTLVMKDKLEHMQRVAQKQALAVGMIYVIFFIWPFLWSKQDYYLPIGWIAFVMLGFRMAKTSITENEAASLNASSNGSSSVKPESGANSLQAGVGSEQVASFVQQATHYQDDTYVDSTDDSYV